MKNLKKFALAAACVMCVSGSGFAWNQFEKTAQNEINNYLRKNYDTRVRDDDHSVNFVVDKNIYWLTFEGDANGMLYTLHRRPIKLSKEGQSASELNELRENATFAASRINGEKPYKVFVKGDQVQFEMPVFAASPEDYKKIFPRVLSTLRSINQDDFKRVMKQSEVVTDSIHNHWQNYAPGKIVVSQPQTQSPSSAVVGGYVQMFEPLVSSVDANGMTLIDYNKPLYRDKLKFAKARVVAKTDKAGTYNMALKIVNPDGKVLVPNKNSSYTVSMPVELSKKDKTIEFAPFGSNDSKLWKPGTYTFVFFVDGKEMMRQQFTVN